MISYLEFVDLISLNITFHMQSFNQNLVNKFWLNITSMTHKESLS